MEELLRRIEAEGHAYLDFTKVQIFVNGLYPEYCIHVSTLTLANFPDAYSRAKVYETNLIIVNLLALTNLIEAAIYKLTKVRNVIMSQ
ncbi:9309_t:CDS:2, partial [Diversispora eburnea]